MTLAGGEDYQDTARRLAALIFICVSLAGAPASASVLSVSSPSVREGEINLEAGAAVEHDAVEFAEYAFEVSYSPTAFWNTALEFSAEDRNGEVAYAVSAWKNTLQFMRQDDRTPVSAALRLQYELAHAAGEADEIAARLLLRHDSGPLSYRLNVGVEREIGGGANSALIGDLRAAVRYDLGNGLAPAIEYLGDTGSLHALQRFENQDHRLGPVLYADVTDTLRLGVGYYAPLSGGAPDHTFKITVEHAFPR